MEKQENQTKSNLMHSKNYAADEIDLLELWHILWQGKWAIIGITFIFAVASVVYALSLPDLYRTEILLSPSEEENNNSGGLMGQLGGLASIAGVDITGGASTSTKVKALAILRSRVFLYDFFKKHEITIPFMASRPSSRSGEVEIDPEIYDMQNQRWVREVEPPNLPEPSDWEVYIAFTEILDIVEDPATGLILVSLEWYDQEQIKIWLDWLIADLNEQMRQSDVSEANRAIDYVIEQIGRTQLVEMRNVLYSLIEQQTRTVMLADAREGYAFETIDPPIIPERRSAPSRSIICIIITVFGGVIAVFSVFIWNIIRKS